MARHDLARETGDFGDAWRAGDLNECCEGEVYEVRAVAGTSFGVWGREGFVNAKAGHRARGNCTRDLAELAVGLNFAPDWHVNLKLWNDGGGETGVAKVEAVIMRDFRGIGWASKSWKTSRKRAGFSTGACVFPRRPAAACPGRRLLTPRQAVFFRGAVCAAH